MIEVINQNHHKGNGRKVGVRQRGRSMAIGGKQYHERRGIPLLEDGSQNIAGDADAEWLKQVGLPQMLPAHRGLMVAILHGAMSDTVSAPHDLSLAVREAATAFAYAQDTRLLHRWWVGEYAPLSPDGQFQGWSLGYICECLNALNHRRVLDPGVLRKHYAEDIARLPALAEQARLTGVRLTEANTLKMRKPPSQRRAA